MEELIVQKNQILTHKGELVEQVEVTGILKNDKNRVLKTVMGIEVLKNIREVW